MKSFALGEDERKRRQLIIDEFSNKIVKFKNPDDKFGFGIYENKSLRKVKTLDPFYIHWLFFTSGLIFNLSQELEIFLSKKSVIELDFKLPFGRKKGFTIRQLILKDPQYFEWLYNNVLTSEDENVEVSKNVEKFCKENLILDDSYEDNEGEEE